MRTERNEIRIVGPEAGEVLDIFGGAMIVKADGAGLPLLHLWRRCAGVPDVAGHPPSIPGFSLVDRDVLADLLHRWAASHWSQADGIIAAFERPFPQHANLFHGEGELHAKLTEQALR